MAEGVKTDFTVVSTHAAFTHTAESQMGGSQMDDHIVNAAAAVTATLGHFPNSFFIFYENIKCQRFGFLCKQAIYFFQIISAATPLY